LKKKREEAENNLLNFLKLLFTIKFLKMRGEQKVIKKSKNYIFMEEYLINNFFFCIYVKSKFLRGEEGKLKNTDKISLFFGVYLNKIFEVGISLNKKSNRRLRMILSKYFWMVKMILHLYLRNRFIHEGKMKIQRCKIVGHYKIRLA
jgi:hypothetical protein